MNRRWQRALCSAVLFGVAALGACNTNAPSYFAAMAPLVSVAMDPNAAMATPPPSSEVDLVFRNPTDAERKTQSDQSKMLGFKVPWLRRDKISISVQYEIQNLADQDGTAQILVDGANEYTDYDSAAITAAVQAATMAKEPPLVLALVQGPVVSIAAHGSYSGNVREDDIAEAELDLDAIGRWMAEPTSVLINRSDVNPVGLEMVPQDVVVPAMWKIKVSLQASPQMRLTYVVRVRDDDNFLLQSGNTKFAPKPTMYEPAAAMAAMNGMQGADAGAMNPDGGM